MKICLGCWFRWTPVSLSLENCLSPLLYWEKWVTLAKIYIKLIVCFHFAQEIEVPVCLLAQSTFGEPANLGKHHMYCEGVPPCLVKPRAVPSLCCSSTSNAAVCFRQGQTSHPQQDFVRAVYRDDKQLPAQLRHPLAWSQTSAKALIILFSLTVSINKVLTVYKAGVLPSLGYPDK